MLRISSSSSSLLLLSSFLLLCCTLLPAPTQAFTLQSLFGSSTTTSTPNAAPPAPLKAAAVEDAAASAKRTASMVVPPLPADRVMKHKSAVSPSPLFYLARFALALAPSSLVMVGAGALTPVLLEPVAAVHAAEATGGTGTEFKIKKGAASTLNTGSIKIITRGVNIENANFEGKDLSGVSFQQSLVRDGNFKGTQLVAASFFDADCTNANFENANMDQVNLELANMRNANLKNALVREAYLSGVTRLTDIQIEGSDWSDTLLRKDQQQYLCKRASGVNPITKISTKDSLGCPE